MSNFLGARRSILAAFTIAVVLSVPNSAFSAVLGALVTVQTDGDVLATYRGNTADFNNDLYLDSPNGFYSSNIIFNNHASPVGSTVDLGFFAAGHRAAVPPARE